MEQGMDVWVDVGMSEVGIVRQIIHFVTCQIIEIAIFRAIIVGLRFPIPRWKRLYNV